MVPARRGRSTRPRRARRNASSPSRAVRPRRSCRACFRSSTGPGRSRTSSPCWEGRWPPRSRRRWRCSRRNRLLVDGEHRPFDEDAVTAAASFAAAVTRQTTQADALAAIGQGRVCVLGAGPNADEIGASAATDGDRPRGRAPARRRPRRRAFRRRGARPRRGRRPSRQLNAIAVERRDPWLQVLPYDGRLVVVGPLFVPGVSACRQCYLLRRAACLRLRRRLRHRRARAGSRGGAARRSPRSPPPSPRCSPLRWLTTRDPTLPGTPLRARGAGTSSGCPTITLLRVPRCPACGSPDQAVPSPWFEATA